MTKKTASEEALEELHKELAIKLKDRITSGEATAAELNVARQFLKDNGIDAAPKGESPLGDLANELPFTDPESIARAQDEYHH
jgi:hypothetical protein